MPVKIEVLTTVGQLTKYKILEILKEDSSLAYTSEELAELIETSTTTIMRSLKPLLTKKEIKKAYHKGKTNKIPYYYLNSKIEVIELN